MSGTRRITSSAKYISVLLLLLVVAFVAMRLLAPLRQTIAAVPGIVTAATKNSNDLLGLGIICVGAGIFVMSDRRRRARGRQASS